MNSKIRLTLPLLALVAMANAQTPAEKPKLGLGDKAPAIKVAKWIKGKPVKSLADGKVHVVEFWATWCGPCKVSIPHLTELAKKYKGKADFVGVSVWEHQDKADFMENVAKFVKEKGTQMDYIVGADGKDNTMAQTWMAAADQPGIPTAFVVDKTGQVVWIGHPMVGLDEAVGQVLAGTYDLKAEMDRQAKAAAEQAKQEAIMKPLNDALRAKDYKAGLVALDKIVADNPEMEPRLAYTRYNLLLRTDANAAVEYGQKLSEGLFKDDADALNAIAWSLVDDKSPAKDIDYKVAVAIAQKASDLKKNEDPMILDTLAYAQFKAGDVDTAIATEEKAISLSEKADSKVDADTLKELKDRLVAMKAKKG